MLGFVSRWATHFLPAPRSTASWLRASTVSSLDQTSELRELETRPPESLFRGSHDPRASVDDVGTHNPPSTMRRPLSPKAAVSLFGDGQSRAIATTSTWVPKRPRALGERSAHAATRRERPGVNRSSGSGSTMQPTTLVITTSSPAASSRARTGWAPAASPTSSTSRLSGLTAPARTQALPRSRSPGMPIPR